MYEHPEHAEMSPTAILGSWYWFIDSSRTLATAVIGVFCTWGITPMREYMGEQITRWERQKESMQKEYGRERRREERRGLDFH